MLFKIAVWLLSMQTLFKPCPCQKGNDSVRTKYTIDLVEKKRLPLCINESSGLIVINDTLYSHNDSGGLPFLYRFSESGELFDSVKIQSATNVDWEDITKDPSGNIYIGDFGNNENIRTNLCIYKFDKQRQTQKLAISYEAQKEFPPLHKKDKNYDCEAMLSYQNKLVFFSKEIKSKREFVYQTDFSNNNTIKLKPWFDFKIQERITGATIINNDTIAILSYGKIVICKLPDISDSKPVIRILYCKKLPFARQCEAITYSKNILYITNEQGVLFKYSLTTKANK